MYNRYRLTSTVYDREDEAQKIIPEKRVFLINAKVDVEVLRRGKKDTNSAPQQVIELLEEYVRLREQNEDDVLQEVSEQFKEQFSLDFIKQFLETPDKLPKKQRNLFENLICMNVLSIAGIMDINVILRILALSFGYLCI